ncbi:CAP domain-containing protein [Streptoalloteichus hindustanus]|uniref:CAP domain-containing protein n=1 Tax=Streptoalloteichus hindustanus TaxID=2017 RepID=UPI001F3F5A62|nr:CAP domain-containing protein [Streptoalloteichus hindustanus]
MLRYRVLPGVRATRLTGPRRVAFGALVAGLVLVTAACDPTSPTVGGGAGSAVDPAVSAPAPVALSSTFAPSSTTPGSSTPAPSDSASATSSTPSSTASTPATPSAGATSPSGPATTAAPGTTRPRPPVSSSRPAPANPEMSEEERRVAELTNGERDRAGCPALRIDNRLNASARGHSADMAAQNYFDHRSLDGRSFADRIRAAGYPNPGAENISAGQTTPEAVVRGWMNSPGHRANILNCDLRALGVGMARGGSYRIYWTQNFGW